MSNETETKIIITHRGKMASIGIQRTGCDPVFFTAEGDIQTSLSRIPEFIEESERKWQTNPLYPKAELPVTPPTQAPATSHQAANITATLANKPQEAMF